MAQNRNETARLGYGKEAQIRALMCCGKAKPSQAMEMHRKAFHSYGIAWHGAARPQEATMKNLNPNCAFRKGITCVATMQNDCANCGFAKTKFELETSRKTAYRRLRSLSQEQQERISQNYFSGAQPWKRKEEEHHGF